MCYGLSIELCGFSGAGRQGIFDEFRVTQQTLRGTRSPSLTFRGGHRTWLSHWLQTLILVSTGGKSRNFANLMPQMNPSRAAGPLLRNLGRSLVTCLRGNACLPRDTSGWSQMAGIYLVSLLLLQPHPAQDSHHPRFHHLYPVTLYFSWPLYSYL